MSERVQFSTPMHSYLFPASVTLSPFLVAASAAFVTPVSTPVVTLVVEPGWYEFVDFVKTGVPQLLLTHLVTLLVAPLIFPYHG